MAEVIKIYKVKKGLCELCKKEKKLTHVRIDTKNKPHFQELCCECGKRAKTLEAL
jgi:hypothetical protein